MSIPALDTVLYGADPTERVVAVEPDLSASTVTLFTRGQDGVVSRSTRQFVPWLLTQADHHFPGSQTRKLIGSGYGWRIDFHESGWQGYTAARRALNDEHAGVVAYSNATRQFLSDSGITLFKGMAFDDLLHMQIDIETSSLDPRAPGARIFMIATSDNAGHSEVLADRDEKTIIERMIAMVRECDPDVIEGHNFFGFDLPYIAARCAALGIACRLGRDDNAPLTTGAPRNVSIGANTRSITPYYIHGRHIIDTYLAVQRFDVAKGQITSYGLKECARVYKIAPLDRVYIEGDKIAEMFETDPQTVAKYASQDVEETRLLAALVSPIEFYQAQMTPESYQGVALMGTGEKINSLLVREYLRQDLAIPQQQYSTGFGGGYTEVRLTGVIAPVVKADVESLYPSIMLTRRIKPESDSLDIFLPMLAELTQRRLAAKAEARRHPAGSREQSYWDGLQNSFKILINSFYGYIGGPFYFNDYKAADMVTETGRQIVKQLAEQLEATGSRVIEIDTDGVYFKPPDGIATYDDELAYIEQIGSILPDGIRLAHDGRYRSMLSLKIKNYVLVEEDGKKIFKGSALRSRADEPYGRKFLTQAVEMLVDGHEDALPQLYAKAIADIETGKLSVGDLARRERITDKMLSSELKRRAADAIKDAGLKVGDIVQLYQRADRTLALAGEYAGDEDRDHYVQKLHKFALRLKEAFSEADFDRIFPKPVPASKRPDPNQGAFEF